MSVPLLVRGGRADVRRVPAEGFDVEIDLVLMLEAEQRGQFGAVRANRRSLPICRVEVEACYEGREDDLGCVNPEFHELPLGEPSFRIFAQVSPSA